MIIRNDRQTDRQTNNHTTRQANRQREIYLKTEEHVNKRIDSQTLLIKSIGLLLNNAIDRNVQSSVFILEKNINKQWEIITLD